MNNADTEALRARKFAAEKVRTALSDAGFSTDGDTMLTFDAILREVEELRAEVASLREREDVEVAVAQAVEFAEYVDVQATNP